jgi:hypothetical protein
MAALPNLMQSFPLYISNKQLRMTFTAFQYSISMYYNIPTYMYLLISDDKLKSRYSIEDDDSDHVPVEVVVVLLGVGTPLSLTNLQL